MLYMFDNISDMDTKELNLINLHSAIKLIDDCFNNSNKTILECYKSRAQVLISTFEESLKYQLMGCIDDVNLEVMCLSKECFGNNGFNATKGINDILKTVKPDLPSEFSSMNGERMLKLFRDSIVHNSKTDKHIADNGSINLSINQKASTEVSIDIPKKRMLQYMLEYDNARKLERQFYNIYIDDAYSTLDDMLKAKKKLGSFQKFIKVYDPKGNEVLFDKYQESAYLRFLIKYKKLDSKLKAFEYLKIRFLPLPDNKLNNYELKSRLLSGFVNFYLNANLKTSDLVRYFKDYNDDCGKFCYTDSETLISIIYSSICFSMLSARTNQELNELLKEAEINIDEDNVRHLRNSFIHGRYFYNYKNGFEIYDGAKELSHVMTFNFEEIEKLYKVFASENIKKIKEARMKLKLEKLIKEDEL